MDATWPVRVRGEVDGDWFVVQVDDSGVGIASERREKVFATFYSESGTGSGLGLAIAREITRAMGGDITIKDAPAGGARFIVRVPCAPCPPRSDAD
jgi:two-component system osmolarity sensor histidine kinase EnvZ